jgi:hypothetical protein
MSGFSCSSCGQYHPELPRCWGSPAPALYYSIPEADRESRALLSSDQCIIDDKHFFVLGRVVIPVEDGGEFEWLAWVSLSEANFERASELWNEPGRESEPPYFGWLQSALPYAPPTVNLKAALHTQPVGSRPLIILHEPGHPLAREQHNGMSVSRVREIAGQMLHGVSS